MKRTIAPPIEPYCRVVKVNKRSSADSLAVDIPNIFRKNAECRVTHVKSAPSPLRRPLSQNARPPQVGGIMKNRAPETPGWKNPAAQKSRFTLPTRRSPRPNPAGQPESTLVLPRPAESPSPPGAPSFPPTKSRPAVPYPTLPYPTRDPPSDRTPRDQPPGVPPSGRPVNGCLTADGGSYRTPDKIWLVERLTLSGS